jgi:hypothetical protein
MTTRESFSKVKRSEIQDLNNVPIVLPGELPKLHIIGITWRANMRNWFNNDSTRVAANNFSREMITNGYIKVDLEIVHRKRGSTTDPVFRSFALIIFQAAKCYKVIFIYLFFFFMKFESMGGPTWW